MLNIVVYLISINKNFSHYNDIKASLNIGVNNLFDCVGINGSISWDNVRLSNAGYKKKESYLNWYIYAFGYFNGWIVSTYVTSPIKMYDGYMYATKHFSTYLNVAWRKNEWTLGISISDMGRGKGTCIYNNYMNPLIHKWSEMRIPDEGNLVKLEITYQLSYRRRFNKKKMSLKNQVVDKSVLHIL